VLLHKRRESGVDLGFAVGLQDKDLHPFHARRLLHVWDHGLGDSIVRVYQGPNWHRVSNEL